MSNIRRVYSTEQGRICPECNNQVDSCNCHSKKKSAVKSDGIVRVRREVKGRKGKTVTTVSGVPRGHEEMKDLSRRLKQKLGTGGSVKDGVIEIQGDHVDKVIAELTSIGFTVKRSGG